MLIYQGVNEEFKQRPPKTLGKGALLVDFMEELLWNPTCDAPREAATPEAETKSPFLPWCPS